jgi:hypothetical protein
LRCQLADLEELEAERLDLSQHAVQGRLVQEPGEHGFRVVQMRRQPRERGQHRGAEVAVDPDRVPDGCGRMKLSSGPGR